MRAYLIFVRHENSDLLSCIARVSWDLTASTAAEGGIRTFPALAAALAMRSLGHVCSDDVVRDSWGLVVMATLLGGGAFLQPPEGGSTVCLPY